MRPDERPAIRQLRAGDMLFHQDEQATTVALVLDGVFEVRVDGEVVGHVGPGTVVGERAHLESGRRTADLRATTDARVAEVPAEHLDIEDLSELALGHHREDG
jgi:CRP-like cAMP-binding protein